MPGVGLDLRASRAACLKTLNPKPGLSRSHSLSPQQCAVSVTPVTHKDKLADLTTESDCMPGPVVVQEPADDSDTPSSRKDAAALDREDPLAEFYHRFQLPPGQIYLDGCVFARAA